MISARYCIDAEKEKKDRSEKNKDCIEAGLFFNVSSNFCRLPIGGSILCQINPIQLLFNQLWFNTLFTYTHYINLQVALGCQY